MKKKLILSFFLFTALRSFSQTDNFDYSTADSWQQHPQIQSVHALFDSSSAVGILQEKKIEYKIEGKNKDVFVYKTYHNIIKIKNDRGIEMYNKVYIPVYEDAQIMNIKARTILANNMVIDLDTTTIKESEEDGETYKIFALEGVDKGSEVEYTFTIKKYFAGFGSEFFQTESTPYQTTKFMLITPQYLRFSAKGYNGFKVSSDSVIDDKRIITGYDNDIKQLEDEKYAFRDKYLERVDYKLSYNLDNSAYVRFNTWNEFAKKAFPFYTTRSSKEDKALDNFIQQIKFPSNADDAHKILAVEDYIKTNINIDKKLIAQGSDDIEKIVKNKACDDAGAERLFAGIFDKLGIGYQIVFPGDRTSIELDEELENWNRLDDVLFYFPSTKKFISPTAVELRYPLFPFGFGETKGLFLKGTTIGTFTTAIGSFSNVPLQPYDSTLENLEADVKFNDTNDTLLISSKQILTGYAAASYRPVYVFLPKDKQDDATNEIVKAISGSTDVTNIKVENTKLTDFFDNKPLIISADTKNTELIEAAGNKILLKIGEVIGKQEEMYQEKPRQLPAEMAYPQEEDRKITLHIPDGYVVKNPEALNSNIVIKNGDAVSIGFTSSYVQNGNTIVVTIRETYRTVFCPLSSFSDFQKVINASADFNKVVLALVKK